MINVKLGNVCTVRIISYILTHECLKGIVETIVSCFVTDGIEPAYMYILAYYLKLLLYFFFWKRCPKKNSTGGSPISERTNKKKFRANMVKQIL